MKKQSVDNQRKVKKKNKLVDNQHKYVVFKEMVEEKSEKHEKKKKKDFNNNIIALLAIFFMVFSLALNYITITSVQVEEEPIGRATDEAAVTLCLNAKPLLNETCSDTAPINTIYYCQLNYSDRDNVSISFTDNTSFFDVNSTGEIRFMPDITYNGSHSITLTVSDGTSCDNHRTSINKTLNIVNCVEPTWTEFMNPMSTNFSEFFCWDSVDNATIAIPGIGMINYSGQVLDLNDVNLDTAIDLSNNNITVHSELVPVLNRTARNRLFNLTTINPQIQLNGEKCPSSICTKLSYANGNLTFDVEHFTTYSTIEGVTINTWDTSDNYSIYVQNYVTYYGAYAYANGSSNLAGYCNMTLNSSDPSNGEYYDMNYNSSSNLFEYTHYFDRRTQGTHNYTIFCNDADGSALNLTDSYTITNRAPVLISDMPNETWPEDTTLSGRDLDNYFMDPDGDVINFSNTKVLNIDVIIDNTTHRITLIPDRNFYGERTVVYFGTDPFNSSASSNIVTLTVVDVEEQEQPPPPPPAGGGGGAGRKDCVERWECTAFGPCLHTGIRVRECVDLARCGSELRKPKLFEDCVYEASCYDLIMNGDEEGVDCGGR